MKNKVRLVTIVGMLLIMDILLLTFWIRGRRMENRYEADSELFQATAEILCNKSIEMDWPVLVRKTDSVRDISKYEFSKSDIAGIQKIFRTTNCCSIYADESCCKFKDGRINFKTGLIYISDADQVVGKDAEDLVYSDVYVETAYFIDKQWIYYEGIPSYAMD